MSPKELVAAARRLDAAGFMPSKSGNLSIRTGEGFIVTPAALPYAAMTEADLVRVGLDGSVETTARHPPSSEWRLHAAVYGARPEAGAVVHTHSRNATAFSQAGLPIPCLGTTHADYFYGEVPVSRRITAMVEMHCRQ